MNEQPSIADQYTRALLVDIDSVIPNLALMHISAWIKDKGGIAGWNIDDPTHAFISVIFTKNKGRALSVAKMLEVQYPNIKMDIGGTGYDLHKRIKESEHYAPDYSLYPNLDYGIGYTTRGCTRKCSFCSVPEMYNGFEIAQHPSEFVNKGSKKIRILDDNILLNVKRFGEVTKWAIDNDMIIDFENLDIRLMNLSVAERLKQLRHSKPWHFAFDDMSYADKVEYGLKCLKTAGINVKNNCTFYVYLDSDKDFYDALERCNILRAYGTNSYLMINGSIPAKKRTQRMIDLKRWCFPSAYWASPFSDYDRRATNDC